MYFDFNKKIQNLKTKSVSNVTVFYLIVLFSYWTFSILIPISVILYTFFYKYFLYLKLYVFTSIIHNYFVNYISKYNIYKLFIDKIKNSIDIYFNIKRINMNPKLLESNSKIKTMYAEFPHGIFTIGFLCNSFILSKHKFKNVVFDILCNIPFFGDFLQTNNCIDSNKYVLQKNMQNGYGIHILPGGFHEIFLSENFNYNIYVPTGFIAMCVKYKYQIIPILNLGENETFYIYKIPNKYFSLITNLLSIIKIPIFLAFGNLIPFLPYNVNIWSIYGEPIECIQNENESLSESVSRIHSLVCLQIKNMFDKNIINYCTAYNLDDKLYKLKIFSKENILKI